MGIRRKNKSRQIVLGRLPMPSPFRRPLVTCIAKFDFIQFTKPPKRWLTPKLRQALEAARIERRLKRPEHSWTIHDPTPPDLNGLVNHFFDAEILGLELAVDFFPRSASGLTHEALYDYLIRALWPRRFLELGRARRAQWVGRGSPLDDRLGILETRNTVYWKEPRRYFELKLYIKPGRGRERRRVRVELRMNRGGCQLVELDRMGKLPRVLPRLRVTFRDAFTIVEGTKYRPDTSKSRKPERLAQHRRKSLTRAAAINRAFTSFGAEWAARKGLRPAPDAAATRVVGSALQALSLRERKVEIHPKQRTRINRALASFRF